MMRVDRMSNRLLHRICLCITHGAHWGSERHCCLLRALGTRVIMIRTGTTRMGR